MDDIIRESKQRKDYLEESKQNLTDEISKRIKTTMIGAINSIEKNFDEELNGENPDLGFLKKFKEVRKRILDLGNEQILRVKSDVENYNVEWKRFQPKDLIEDKT